MEPTTEEKNKAIVLEAYDTLFNKRDIAGAQKFWSPDYIQHSANVPPGRQGLFNLLKGIPEMMRYECDLIMAEGDRLMLHGRYSGLGAAPSWIALDIVRMEDGVMIEHWDVIQDEATQANSLSGNPMFGKAFPKSGEANHE